jgi:hypothetical protein
MPAYEYASESRPKLTSPSEAQEEINGLKVDKAPGPNGVPNRVEASPQESHNLYHKID